jgi:hypothetical protein
MKPTDWNNRWWFSCAVEFKTSYGVIQQSLFLSPIYSKPDVDCPKENVMRAQQLMGVDRRAVDGIAAHLKAG